MIDSARNPLALARYELKRFRGPLPRLAMVFILLIPLLYGCIYLAANWDPYGRLDEVPVAVVNHDRPTTFNDKEIHAGQDFVESLHEAGTFKFVDTTDEDAADGLEHGRFYLVITVPEDFSTDLVSGQGDHPERAQIMLRRNDANGFVIGTITNSAQNSIARAIDETAVRSYFEAVFANLQKIREGMQSASDGATKLSDGLTKAKDGSTQLRAGLNEAAPGADALASGAGQLSTGATKAADGAGKLASGLHTLDDGAGRLATGSRQVADGTQQLADTVDPVLSLAAEKLPAAQERITRASTTAADLSANLASRTDSVASKATEADAALASLLAAHPEIADDPAVERLQSRLDEATEKATTVNKDAQAVAADVAAANTALKNAGDLGDRAASAKAKVGRLNTGAHQVATGASDLHHGADQAATAADQLSSGVGQLADGATRLSNGAGTLASGLHKLSDGSASLDEGLGQLASGANELATGLRDGVARIPVLTADEQDDAAQVLSAPVDVTMSVDNPAHVYGRGLAPMFFSIALWVLGISAFFIVRPITGRVITGRASDLRIAITAWLPLATISVVAGWLMLGAAWLGLGLDPVHPWLTILLVAVIALAFSSVAHLLRTSLGLVSTAAMLVVLILQLASAGGTYPPELLPPFFANLSHVMPMTYTIDAFRIAISGGLMDKFWRDIILLLLLLASCVTLLVLVVRSKRRFRLSDLHPPLG